MSEVIEIGSVHAVNYNVHSSWIDKYQLSPKMLLITTQLNSQRTWQQTIFCISVYLVSPWKNETPGLKIRGIHDLCSKLWLWQPFMHLPHSMLFTYPRHVLKTVLFIVRNSITPKSTSLKILLKPTYPTTVYECYSLF